MKIPETIVSATRDGEALLEQYVELSAKLEKIKSVYAEIDAVTMKLLDGGFSPKVGIRYKDKVFTMVDNFAEKNVAYRVAAVRRFELKVVE